MKPVIAITMGDFNGIGPEIALQASISPLVRKVAIPVLVGSIDVFEYYAKHYKMKLNIKEVDKIPRANIDGIPIIAVRKFTKPKINLGKITNDAGRLALESIMTAIVLHVEYGIDGIVTGPICKSALDLPELNFSGQTELLSAIYKSQKSAMILVHNNFRIAIATPHIALNEVAKRISKNLIIEKLSIFHKSLQLDFGIKDPSIAVLALNPHAGENGLFGNEEKKTLTPTIAKLNNKGLKIFGPFPADGFFGSGSYKKYDGTLAMYHDQALIPFKLMGFDKGVNFTAGLPLVRTSPNHGTAFDLAGKGIASPRSIIEAARVAVKIIKNRKQKSVVRKKK